MLLFSEYAPEAYFDMVESLCCLFLHGLDYLPMASSVPGMTQPFAVANVNSMSWKRRDPKGEEMFCSGPGFEWLCWNPVSVLTMVLQKHSVNSWLKTFFFFETFASLLSIYSFTYFKVPSACLLLLGAVFSSPWWTVTWKFTYSGGLGEVSLFHYHMYVG